MNRAALLVGLLVLSSGCRGEADADRVALPSGAVILPVSEGRLLLEQCSRASPAAADAVDAPDPTEVRALEAALPSAVAASQIGPILLDDFARQYVGLMRGGRRFVYGNFARRENAGPDWRTRAVLVCDGGPSFFGVEYDVAAGRFIAIDANGPL